MAGERRRWEPEAADGLTSTKSRERQGDSLQGDE